MLVTYPQDVLTPPVDPSSPLLTVAGSPSPASPGPARPGPGSATGVGSLPGTDMDRALRLVRDELVDLPHLPELPARGPGADLVGRTAVRLVDLPVDLQPYGWRLVDRPGRDVARGEAFWREDVDRLAGVFDGFDGLLKVQLCGPWTSAAHLWLPRGERVVSDRGARRDLTASMVETVPAVLAEIARAVPGARLVLQVDEPALPAVLDGRLTSVSGLNRLRPVPREEVVAGLAQVVTAARNAGAATALHCCADDPPVSLMTRTGVDALALDVSLLGPQAWESVATGVEAGVRLWAGVPVTGARADAATVGAPERTPAAQRGAASTAAGTVEQAWRRVGLSLSSLADVVLTPPCGLAGADAQEALAILRSTVRSARELAERSGG